MGISTKEKEGVMKILSIPCEEGSVGDGKTCDRAILSHKD
jgi:hypothetical protein|tara:strand:+ start:1239 stop:1358 length:120 start_codon:yes stop_codon:yes gene_type:complete